MGRFMDLSRYTLSTSGEMHGFKYGIMPLAAKDDLGILQMHRMRKHNQTTLTSDQKATK